MIDPYGNRTGPVTWEEYDAVVGKGGEEKFQQVSDEIDKQCKVTEDELSKSKKTYSELSPFEQIIFNLDLSLEKSRQMQENKKLEHLRNLQFKEYVRNFYGIDY